MYGCAHEDVHSSQFTTGKTCCCRLLHDGRSLLHVWFFFGYLYACDRTNGRPTESEWVALYARILHLSCTQKKCICTQTKKNAEDNDGIKATKCITNGRKEKNMWIKIEKNVRQWFDDAWETSNRDFLIFDFFPFLFPSLAINRIGLCLLCSAALRCIYN